MVIILLWGVIAFLFFHIGYKHHLFYQEQNQLFLLSWEYVKSYYTGFGWLARLTGDFLTQFYYYLLAGPAILTVFLLLLGGATYQLLRHWRVGRWWSLAVALVVMTTEAVFCLHYGYRLSSVVSHVGVIGTLAIVTRRPTPALPKREGGKRVGAGCSPSLIRRAVMIQISLFLACWLFGFSLPTKLTLPEMEFEKALAVSDEYYFGNYDRVIEMTEQEEQPSERTLFYYNLVQAQRGNLPDVLLRYQPNQLGTFYEIPPETPLLVIKDMNELYWALGDMTYTECAAMMGNVFSIENRNVRMVRRLAECNLVSGDHEATEKYLRLLDKTLVWSRWAKTVRENGNDIYRDKMAMANKKDTIVLGDNSHQLMMQLLDSNPHNTVALDYILCSDLLLKDITNFKRDYDRYCSAEPRMKPLYQQALCIWLAGTNAPQDDWAKYIRDNQMLQQFAAYNQQRGSSQFAGTYWYYFDKGEKVKK